MSSRKPGFLCELFLSQVEGIHAIVGQFRKECNACNAGQLSGSSRRQLAHLKQLYRGRHAHRAAEFFRPHIQRQRGPGRDF